MKIVKRLLKYFTIIIGTAFLFLVVSELLVETTTADRVFNSVEEVPNNKVGLLLGTSKRLRNGHINLYYKYRVNAAVKLYNANKVEFILVSGDNGTKQYDEPTMLKNDLVQNGIPANKIYLDYAGFRTYDSVVRCKEIFGQSSFTVISQQFHNERAIYIAKSKGIEAVGFNAKDVGSNYGLKTKIRERLARMKMILDIIFGKEPKFLGDQIEIQ